MEQPGRRRADTTRGTGEPDGAHAPAAPAQQAVAAVPPPAPAAPPPPVPAPRVPDGVPPVGLDRPGGDGRRRTPLAARPAQYTAHDSACAEPESAATRGERPVPDGATAPQAAPVRRHSVRGQILEALRAALAAGELEPGEVYSAPVLGARFGVSATPVREAMQQLAHEGAVEVVPNRGFRVAERSAREVAELAEVRALLEVPVVLGLARSVPAARWAALRPLAEATEAAARTGDVGCYLDADLAFHRAVLSLAGNEQLVAVADDLHRRARLPSPAGAAVQALHHADLAADAAEHTALIDALSARDLSAAESVVRRHFSHGRE